MVSYFPVFPTLSPDINRSIVNQGVIIEIIVTNNIIALGWF